MRSPEKSHANIAEKRDREPIATVEIDLARHSTKNKDEHQYLSSIGMKKAAEAGASSGHAEKVIEKIVSNKPLDIMFSSKPRTEQSTDMRMFGEQFKNMNFEKADPQEVVQWINSMTDINRLETPLLDLADGEGQYYKEGEDTYNEKKYFKWIVEKSDDMALETRQDPDKARPFSVYAGNVAMLIWAYGKNKTQEMINGKEKEDFAFGTSHQSILESFLYKIVLKLEGQEAADQLVEDLSSGQGLSENEGYKVCFNNYSEDGNDWDVVVKFRKKEYTATSDVITSIMQEGIDMREKMEKAFGSQE